MRAIGRISFPIFCFLLIEGFMHTHDVKKYALNLGIFALVSEIPFDLAFAGKPFYLDYQNVFFTLFIGLVMMIFLQKIDSKAQKDAGAWQRANWKVSVGKLLVIVAACAVATLLKTDYSAMGILTIVLMYNMRKNKMYCIGIGCAVLTLLSLNEITCFLAMIPVHFYNGKRGLNLKYPFYAFYPVHLLVLFAIGGGTGMAGLRLFKNEHPEVHLRRLGLCPGAQSQTTQTHFRADIEPGGGEVWICCANRREILLNILLNFQRIPQKLFAANHFKILRLKIFA